MKIRVIREEVRMCKEIELRIPKIKENIRELNKEKEIEKRKEKEHEYECRR